MLTEFKLYKNPRGRFISLELHDGIEKYQMRYINKNGKHKFIRYVNLGHEYALIESLKLQEASITEQALNSLYISSPELQVNEWDTIEEA